MHMPFRGRGALSITVVLLLVAAPLMLVFTGQVAAQDNILLATRTQDVITLDGSANEAAWSKAIASDVTVERLTTPLTVEVRALYDDQYIYMAFKWQDQSKSVIPQQWQYTGGVWASIPHKEDRLSLLWNVGDSIVGFEQNKQGCTATCHNSAFKTGSAQEMGDLWQWMAGRTNPSIQIPDVGWMDDLALKDTGIVPDDFTGSKVWERNSVYANDGDDATVPFTANDTPQVDSAPGQA